MGGRKAKKESNRRADQSTQQSQPRKKTNVNNVPKKTSIASKEKKIDHAHIGSQYPEGYIEQQQQILSIFEESFVEILGRDFPARLQEIKKHLYNRDFNAAFGRREFLETYAARWSPSRALAYLDIFRNNAISLFGAPSLSIPSKKIVEEKDENCNEASQKGDLDGLKSLSIQDHDAKRISKSTAALSHCVKVVCLGGGAGAEITALAAHLCGPDTAYLDEIQFRVLAVDIADWSSIISKLESHIKQRTVQPRTAVETNPEIECSTRAHTIMSTEFQKKDILQLEDSDLESIMHKTTLITLLFTLNELYTSSIPATTQFLMKIGMFVSIGTVLLVVDSPGSYSTLALGGKVTSTSSESSSVPPKKYPMHWLLDHTLLDTFNKLSLENGGGMWKKLESSESSWFRLPEGLNYPIELENMRYQLHLYQYT